MPHPAIAIVQAALTAHATAEQIVDRLIEARLIEGVPSAHWREFEAQRETTRRSFLDG